jgi:hypothetical protein
MFVADFSPTLMYSATDKQTVGLVELEDFVSCSSNGLVVILRMFHRRLRPREQHMLQLYVGTP